MRPRNNLVTPLLTDLYQLTMAYSYWKNSKHENNAVFDLFFRKNPFGGEFTIFAGLEEVLRFVNNFRFTEEDIDYLKNGVQISKSEAIEDFDFGIEQGYIRANGNGYEQYTFPEFGEGRWEETKYPEHSIDVKPPMPDCEPAFFKWLSSLDCSKIKINSFREGAIVFPKLPLLRVEGPIAIAQLLETPLLTLVNYSSLVATKAARLRLAAGEDKKLLEFGLRRAQGPDGALSASRYSFIGGFNATSNVTAGKIFGIPISGTHAHSFVSSFNSFEDLPQKNIVLPDGKSVDFVSIVLRYRKELEYDYKNEGELAAFIAYAISFPNSFLALTDTYDLLKSGIPNFLCTALALKEIGYTPLGIRLDSGDLAYYSKEARKIFKEIDNIYHNGFSNLNIVASNDIDEPTLISLNQQGHEIDTFGIGTHLVTCNGQPSLGGVYKLVSINGSPRIKISQEVSKITLPCKKTPFRLFGADGHPVIDIMQLEEEPEPIAAEKILCRHPFEASKRAYVVPERIEKLHHLVWEGKRRVSQENLLEIKEYSQKQLSHFRKDHLRTLNPTPYKISVSDMLYSYLHKLWQDETPIPTIN